MKYGIVIFPPKEIQNRANSFRKRYDTHYNLIQPHITIKEVFELDHVEEAINYIDNVTKNIPPFSLKINKIKTFLPTSSVLYFAFEDNELIYKLQDLLNSGILANDLKYKFIPHITIAQDLPNQELHDIYSRLKLKHYDLSFLVDRIHLCYQIENESWTVYQTFLLRGNNNVLL